MYRAVNNFRHGYKNQSANAVQSKTRSPFYDPYETPALYKESVRTAL
jgi:hypothetical protein